MENIAYGTSSSNDDIFPRKMTEIVDTLTGRSPVKMLLNATSLAIFFFRAAHLRFL